MRSILGYLLIAGCLAACIIKEDDKDNDDGGRGGSSQGGSSNLDGNNGAGGTGGAGGSGVGGSGGGAQPGAPGWKVMPLIDDKSDPQNTIFRPGNDLVTGMYFTSVDDGIVVTSGSQQTFQSGGAIFRAKQKQITEVLFSGVDGKAKCLLGTTGFVGLEKTSDGYVARAQACDFIASTDGGATFGLGPVGVGETFGLERNLAYRRTAEGATIVRDTGVVSVTKQAPGQNAIWDDIWAPGALPPIPDPVPAAQCHEGPNSTFTPPLPQTVYVSPDARFLAYAVSTDSVPQVCVSTDGGQSFLRHELAGVAEDVLFAAPLGITFANATTGITWFANNIYPDSSYIYRTTDRGATWAKVALPADLAGKGIELNSAFFAPDGVHGWIVGYNYTNSIALALKTTDGGATWSSASGDLASQVDKAGGGKLRSGFALDAYHLWVGGEYGVLVANEAGGE